MPQQEYFAKFGQSLRFRPVQIQHMGKSDRADRFGLQKAKSARLDQAPYGIGRIGQYPLLCGAKRDPVIRNKARTQRHHLERQGRFPRPRSARDQQPTPGDRDTAGMDHGLVTILQAEEGSGFHGLRSANPRQSGHRADPR